MFQILLGIHICICIFMIGVVLLQQGQGADAGVTFGGGSSSSFFGASGGVNFFTRLTTFTCILFMVTSILLVRSYPSVVQAGGEPKIDPLQGSVMGSSDDEGPAAKKAEDQTAPSAPTANTATETKSAEAPTAQAVEEKPVPAAP